MECPDFNKAEGNTWQEKAEEACTNCLKCKGNFPADPAGEVNVTESEDEIGLIVSEVEEIIAERKSGFHFSFEPDLFEFILFWEEIERQIERKQKVELIRVLELQNEILKAGLKVTIK